MSHANLLVWRLLRGFLTVLIVLHTFTCTIISMYVCMYVCKRKVLCGTRLTVTIIFEIRR